MADSNIDFLRFSAYSMKDLITRKLAEDSKFTDQVYEGSNLAILIDIVSYMYQCLAYQLNNAAAESMFADTRLYDNMVRLVKFIGYNPRGCIPTQMECSLTFNGPQDVIRSCKLPLFTYFETQKTGKDGRRLRFSTDETLPLESDSAAGGVKASFYNGQWKPYSIVYTASGIENETFTLNGIRSDSDSGQYASGDHIKIIIATRYADDGTAVADRDGEDIYRYDTTWINDSDGIFTRSNRDNPNYDTETEDNPSTNFYSPQDKIYTVYLNEDKTYEVKFGNGITGRKLMPGDRIYVFYLDSDGQLGEVDLSEIDFSAAVLKHDYAQWSGSAVPAKLCDILFDDESCRKIFEDREEDGGTVQALNKSAVIEPVSTVTTKFRQEESIETIRDNAPGWFKTGNRLITARDTEYYIKANGHKLGLDGIVDVKCMNNMQYVATFYKWLYENGIKSKDEPSRASERVSGVDPGRYYLDNVTFNRANFKYVDPADANNTYLWIKTESSVQDQQVVRKQESINRRLYHLKTITTEYQIVKPVEVKFAICANPDLDDIKARYFKETDVYFDSGCESYIEITLDDNIIYVSSSIQKLVYDEIIKAFNVNSQRLGGVVNFQDIVNNIYAINGVQRVRTVYINGSYSYAYDGVSFASWSEPSVLHFHEDLQIGNVMRHVEEFQFPVLEEANLFNRIKIITKALHQVHAIKF